MLQINRRPAATSCLTVGQCAHHITQAACLPLRQRRNPPPGCIPPPPPIPAHLRGRLFPGSRRGALRAASIPAGCCPLQDLGLIRRRPRQLATATRETAAAAAAPAAAAAGQARQRGHCLRAAPSVTAAQGSRHYFCRQLRVAGVRARPAGAAGAAGPAGVAAGCGAPQAAVRVDHLLGGAGPAGRLLLLQNQLRLQMHSRASKLGACS